MSPLVWVVFLYAENSGIPSHLYMNGHELTFDTLNDCEQMGEWVGREFATYPPPAHLSIPSTFFGAGEPLKHSCSLDEKP